MKIFVSPVYRLALLSLSLFLALDAVVFPQVQIADSSFRPSDLLKKSRAKQKNMNSAATASASGYNFQDLYSFGATAADAKAPETAFIRDASGNLYGASFSGGSEDASIGGAGTIFKLDAAGQESVLYNFCSATNCTDGLNPRPGLTQDVAGNLYGATSAGGVNNQGTVFMLTPPSQSGASWTETVLHSFGATNTDGTVPIASLIQDGKGNLYGTTSSGGAYDYGTVFMLSAPAQPGESWVETVLYSFDGSNGDGIVPLGRLIQDSAGNLFGTTSGGGSTGGSRAGTVFELVAPSQSGGTWTEKVLYNFCSATNCTDGYLPEAGLILDAVGNLYGTTLYGGAHTGTYGYGYGGGTAFRLEPPAQSGGIWSETVLYSFGESSTDGYSPAAVLTQDAEGNLYSTTVFGGANGVPNNGITQGGGTLFKLSPPAQSGGTWTETVLYNFCAASNCTDGYAPQGGLLEDVAGNLYGTAANGGAYGEGSAFKLIVIQTPTLAITPSPSTITSSQALTVGIAVGGVNGDPAPTGTVTLTSGSFTSAATTLASGGATIDIPAGSLSVGTDTLTVSYSGDITYQSATGTASVTVVPGFTISGTPVTVSPGATTANTSTITVTPSGSFTGNVTLTASVTSSPVGANELPTLSFGSTSSVNVNGTSAASATLTVSTTAATSAVSYPVVPGMRWHNIERTAVVFGLLLGISIPTRVRGCRMRLVGLMFALILTGGFIACSSSGRGGGGGGGNHGTTPGNYTVTVTGTSQNTTATCTVTVTVQ